MIELIEKLIVKHFEIDKGLFERNRVRHICYARQVFFFICSRYTKYSLSAIGAYCERYKLKRYDHATVLHATNKISDLYDVYEDVAKDVDHLLNELKDNPNVKRDETFGYFELLNLEQLSVNNIVDRIDFHKKKIKSHEKEIMKLVFKLEVKTE